MDISGRLAAVSIILFVSHFSLNLRAQSPPNPEPIESSKETVIFNEDANVERHIAIGDSLFNSDDLDGAISEYRQALQIRPNNVRARRNVGNALFHKEDYDAAIAEYREAVRLEPDDSATHRILGDLFANKRDLDAAVAEFRAALRLDPGNAGAHMGLAKAFMLKNNYDEAIVEFREVIRLQPDDAESHWSLAIALHSKNDLDGADVENREAIRLNPRDPKAHYGLGRVLLNKNDLNGAFAEFNVTLHLEPGSAEAHHGLGEVLFARNDLNGASAEFSEALRLKPDFPIAHYSLGISLLRAGKTNQAIEELKVAALSETLAAQAYRPLASLLAFVHRYDEALDALGHLERLSPEDVSVPQGIASIMVDQKKYKEAIDELQPAIERNPTNTRLIFLMGRASVRAGDTEKGMVAFQKVLNIQSNPLSLRTIGQELADSNVRLDDALRYSQSAAEQLEASTAVINLESLTVTDLRNIPALILGWDTLGWTELRLGNTDKAEKYLIAAWNLTHLPDSSKHLGQLYEKIGNRPLAIRFYSLTLAADPATEDIRGRLEALLGDKSRTDDAVKVARDDLRQLQTVKLPLLTKGQASAEFFVLFSSSQRLNSAKFISGSEELRSATDAIASADYQFTFPDSGPAKIVRRGTLNCSGTGTICEFVLRQPGSVYSLN